MDKNIVIRPMGGPTNKMIQYLAAHGIKEHCPDAEVFGADLSDWGIETNKEPDLLGRTVEFDENVHHLNVKGIASCLNRDIIDTVYINSYSQYFDNYPDISVARSLFPRTLINKVRRFSSKELVISIRGGEINDGRHPDYILLPASFYSEIIDRTKLKPIFFGQIEDNIYTLSLRARFPQAEFVSGVDLMEDFETLRCAENVVPSISTFSWLACWLGDAKQIHMPVAGLFNPRQARAHNFIPWNDDRYQYYLFPLSYSVNIEKSPSDLFLAHQILNGNIRLLPGSHIRQIVYNAPLHQRRLHDFLNFYNENYYVGCQPDVAAALRAGQIRSGLSHYIAHGFAAERPCFALDYKRYSRQYPTAAAEVSNGEYIDLAHHFVEIGSRRGYSPT